MRPFLRLPTLADYEAITTWIPDAVACSRWAGPLLRFPFTAQELPELLLVPESLSFCMANSNGLPIGFGQFWPRSEHTVHLGRILVSPTSRGNGFGKILCTLLISEALKATNAERITLRVYRDNAKALAIYSSLGFLIDASENDKDVILMLATTQQLRL